MTRGERSEINSLGCSLYATGTGTVLTLVRSRSSGQSSIRGFEEPRIQAGMHLLYVSCIVQRLERDAFPAAGMIWIASLILSTSPFHPTATQRYIGGFSENSGYSLSNQVSTVERSPNSEESCTSESASRHGLLGFEEMHDRLVSICVAFWNVTVFSFFVF